MARGVRSNEDAEPSKRVNIFLTAEDQRLLTRLLPEFHQNGPTGLFRALMREEIRRRFPESVEPRGATVTPIKGAR